MQNDALRSALCTGFMKIIKTRTDKNKVLNANSDFCTEKSFAKVSNLAKYKSENYFCWTQMKLCRTFKMN